MFDLWEEKDILITVKTYPELSTKYTETVCIAGVMAEPRQLVRLYPIRYRYLEGTHKFSKYQWIKAQVKKTPSDTRPETYRINDISIRLGSVIGPGKDWAERIKWILSCENTFHSMEAMLDERAHKNISLAMIRPKEFVRFEIETKAPAEMQKVAEKKWRIMAQDTFFEEKKDLEILPVKFMLEFRCHDSRCKGHRISILDWEIAQLYRKLRGTDRLHQAMEDKVMNTLCHPSKETHLFMGNMAAHQHIFCILGFFYPPRIQQTALPF